MPVGADQKFVVFNMPTMMGRKVTRPSEIDATKWIKDESWYASVREKMYYLFTFFQDYGLLHRKVVYAPSDVDTVILRLSDFTDEGQAFVLSQAPDRWLGSFDRPASKKKRSDTSYLVRELYRQRAEQP
jgi:hypothetical protein